MDELFEFLCKLGIDDSRRRHLVRNTLEIVYADNKPNGNRWHLTLEMKATVRMFLREKGWLDRSPAEDAGDVRIKLPSGYRCAQLAGENFVAGIWHDLTAAVWEQLRALDTDTVH